MNNCEFVENMLNIKLPKDYCNFLNKVGYYYKDGIEVYGYNKNFKDVTKIPCVIGATLIYRKDYNLRPNYIVISSLGYDGIIVVLNSKDGKVYETSNGKTFNLVANSFKEWLKKIVTK